MADRYTYVPLIGIFMMVSWGIPGLLQKLTAAEKPAKNKKGKSKPETAPVIQSKANPALYVPASAVILLLTALTWQQVGTWRNTETLFRHAIQVTEGNCVAYSDLGEMLLHDGRIDEARQNFEAALAARPDSYVANNDLGKIEMDRGDLESLKSAEEHLKRALDSQADSPEVNFNMGMALTKLGRPAEGIRYFDAAINLRPTYIDAHWQKAVALDAQGQIAKSMGEFSQAIKLSKDPAKILDSQGTLLLNHHKLDEAMECFRKALQFEPDLATAHNNLAGALYFKGNYAEAWKEIHSCRRLHREPNPNLVKLLTQKMPDPGEGR
jgi:protein O-mannosyl-transferase